MIAPFLKALIYEDGEKRERHRTLATVLKKMTAAVPDPAIRVAGWMFFLVWLLSWSYSASKMFEFKNIGLRDVALPVEILSLVLWSLCFYVKAYRAFSQELNPVEELLQQKEANAFRSTASLRSVIPLAFAFFLGVIYLAILPFGVKGHPTSPSPAMPAEICFAPMVFFFGSSSFGMRRFQGK